MKKRIPIQELRPGMFIAGLDQSWFKTPFLRHQWRIKREDEISLLRSYGIQEVIIDTERGAGAASETPQAPPSPPFPPSPLPSQASVVSGNPATRPDPSEIESARMLRAEAISRLDMLFHDMHMEDPLHLEEARRIVATLLSGMLEHQAAMLSLIQMRRFDPNLASHGVDTSVLAIAIGQVQQCAVSRLKALGLGALLHDIGQLRLPLNILRKATPYSEQDFKLMRRHPEMGYAMLSPSQDFPEDATRIILDHHERLDGSGYPQQLKGEQISELTQIVSIADTYDAQISGRCGHPPVPPARALAELYRAAIAGQYHLYLVQRLIQLLGVYPIGTLVRLNTGELALVVWVPSHDRLHPTIKLLKDPLGHPYPDHELIDLSTQQDGAPPRNIIEALDPQQEGLDIGRLLESLW